MTVISSRLSRSAAQVNPQGMAEGIVRVEYMPWKGGPTPL
ncbi:hypothetical protein ALQ47_01842 [Pseudomonas cichorii]|nr:hypothetical protein ALQ47_01842 [Pseudomonas cichorii]